MNNNGELTAKRARLPELAILRGMAILGVLSVHSTSYATVDMTNSRLYFIYNFFNIFMKYGTPTFIFLSSFVLFYNYYSRPFDRTLVTSFYRKRLLYILLPYLLFSIFYFILQQVTYYPDRTLSETVDKFVIQILTGKAYTHLYFVFINVQFYLLFPLVLWLVKKWPAFIKWTVPAGLAIQWGFVLLNKYEFQVPNKGSWAFSYFSYFMLGVFLGIYYPKLKGWLTVSRASATAKRAAGWMLLWGVWLAAGLCHVYIWYQTRANGITYNSLLYELLWNVHTFACALALLQLSGLLYRKGPALLAKPLEKIGAVSFGIYLIHPFFLFIYRRYPLEVNGWHLHAWYAGGLVTALLCSWIVVTLAVRYLPFAWMVFGQQPKQKRDRKLGQAPAQALPVKEETHV